METLARSDPASGSLKSWHQTSSPRSIAGRQRCFCSSVPWASSVGPTMPIAMAKTPLDTPWRACSWLKITDSIGLAPRPPYSRGHVMPAHPPSASRPCHSRHRLM